MTQLPSIHVLMIEDKAAGIWTAQCLQFDIAAQAKSLLDLQYELERTLVSHVMISEQLGKVPFAGIGPAPQECFKIFAESKMELTSDSLPFAPLANNFTIPHPAYRVGNQAAA